MSSNGTATLAVAPGAPGAAIVTIDGGIDGLVNSPVVPAAAACTSLTTSH
jgi:hypothetical protein